MEAKWRPGFNPTGLVTRAEGKAGLRIQGHPFLAKPISIPELINGIEENLPARAA